MKPNQILLGDSAEILKSIDDKSIDFIVTSPPYASKRKELYHTVTDDEYVDWFLPISAQLHRVLKDDGSFVLNIKERVADGERSTYVIELILALKKQGWLWIDEYVWYKSTAFPGKWPNRFRDAWERCLHFSKNKKFCMYQDEVMVPIGDWSKPRLKNLSDNDKKRTESATGSGFGKNLSNWTGKTMVYPTNVLELAAETGNTNHPASFPPTLPEWFIKLFSKPEDVVLDPFMGSGSTAVACVRNARNYIGIELKPEYKELAEKRIAQTQPGLVFG